LKATTRDDLCEAWERRVRPRGSILAIAGDVDPDAVAGDLNRLLDGWSGETQEPTWEQSETRGTYHHVHDQSAQVQIIVVHEAPPEPAEESVLERIVTTVLSGGMSARLFSEVREKRGLCYSVQANYATDRAYGRCMAYVGTTPERAQDSLDVLTSELRRINGGPESGGGIDASELERAKIGLKSNLVFAGESTGARASALAADMHRLGRARSLDEMAAAIDRVTLDDVNAYLARRDLTGTTIVTLGPRALKPPL
jgi:predicted Zn-dependent peptidase